MVCIISTFSTLLFIGFGAFLGARWIFKAVRNKCVNISSTIYNAYNLPEATYQKVKVRVDRKNFNLSLGITMLGKPDTEIQYV
jgi:hypothetical protein